MRVLVCDDVQARAEDVLDALEQCGIQDVEPLIGDQLTVELTQLFKRVDRCLTAPAEYKAKDALAFDGVDIAIFDNNLSHLKIEGTRLTGESVVGYVRCFSSATYVVSLNKNPDVDFDLRYLVGDYETKADLALNTEHLANGRLWSGEATKGSDSFRPWYWPVLRSVPNRRRKQIDYIRERLDEAVLGVLEFPTDEESLGFLSLHAKGALSPHADANGSVDGKPITDITFRDVFLAGTRSLPAKEERDLLNGGSTAGNPAIDDLIARVVAADIDRWFRRDVIGPQEMLVDVPHLLMRMPLLLGERANDISEWNATLGRTSAPYGMEQNIFEEHLASASFAHSMWTEGAAFWWPLLKRNDKLGELFFADGQPDWTDAVFCEDTSEFVSLSAASGDSAPVEFSAEFEGSWGRRHVQRLKEHSYAPRSRFAV